MKARKARHLNRTVYIRCEGQTEEFYFEALQTIVNDSDLYFITIQLHKNGKGDPQGGRALIQATREAATEDGYDEAWAVFDHDRVNPATLGDMIQEARKKPAVHIAFSHRAFEHWVLLHFEQNDHDFPRADCTTNADSCTCAGATCLVTYLQVRGHIPQYAKAMPDIYQRLAPFQTVGFRNAAWLRWRQNAEGISQTPQILTKAPYTDVDLFVGKLLAQPAYRWAALGVAFAFRQGTLLVRETAGGRFVIEVYNATKAAWMLRSDMFRVADQIPLGASLLSNPGETQTLSLAFPGNLPAHEPLIFQPDYTEFWHITHP